MTRQSFWQVIQRILVLLICCGAGAGAASAGTSLRVFAAASLKTALDAVAERYEAETGEAVVVAYAASSVLARQIALGAPADVFISANAAWMDDLAAKQHLQEGSRRDLLTNELVVVAPSGTAALGALTDLPAALGARRLAVAQTDAVPAGIYAKAALEAAGIWPQIAGKIAPTDNVRAALALVAAGATPYGIVYKTDAYAEPRVTVAYRIPPGLHPQIVYPAAALSTADGARAFLDFLTSETARTLFEEQGFTALPAR